jgi:hypothetical protein
MGVTPGKYAQFAAEIGLDMAGANCGVGHAELMDSTQGLIATGIEIPVVAKGNGGIPQYVDGGDSLPRQPGTDGAIRPVCPRRGREHYRGLLRHHARAHCSDGKRLGQHSAERTGYRGDEHRTGCSLGSVAD